MQSRRRRDTEPVVGIMTTGKRRTIHDTGGSPHLYRDLILCGRKKGVFIYYFYPRSINWQQRRIKGYSYDGRKWSSGYYSFPDVIYNRILYRTVEQSSEVRSILKRIEKDEDIYMFNSRFLDKWEVHQAISSHQATAHLVPETELLTRESLTMMLNQYPEVLLKPRCSSKGQGIIKVRRSGQGLFSYSRAEWNHSQWVKAFTVQPLIKKLIPLKIFHWNYLVQECIDLTRYKGRIFDLRSQFQKNGTGEWDLTGVGIRIAAKNRFVTHIPNGGHLAAYEEIIPVLDHMDGDQKQSLARQLKRIGLLVPPLLEEKLQLKLAILSMDIGIDQTGKMLILEVNSKPARFDEPQIRHQNIVNLVDYFLFLTRKKHTRNDFQ